MKTIQTNVLDVAYHEYGPADGAPVILLHGFPYGPGAFDVSATELSGQGFRCLVPYLRGFGPARFLSPDTMRSGQQAALAADVLAFMDALGINRAVLGGFDWGGRAACAVAALWPDRVSGLVSCGPGYNISDIATAQIPAPPEVEARFWYMYYFHTERGRIGLTRNRRDLCRHLWSTWSPSWAFDDATFDATATSFENPDFIDIVVHSYRHRFGSVPGDPTYDGIESRLATLPQIPVPSIVLQGLDDGVAPPAKEDFDRPHFDGPYERRIVDGAGHNLPQEKPQELIRAICQLGGK
jgi:pimeloyl-ACP methyl ester carboxylesterase